MGLGKEFKEFAMRGNVIDLAVGVVIGGAFGLIVKSLVDDIIMPIVGVLTGGHDFSTLSVTVGTAVVKYGMFIQAIVNFVIIAFAIFLAIKAINKMKKKENQNPSTPVEPGKEEVLLTEIRDILKNK